MIIGAILVVILLMLLLGVKTVRFLFWIIVLAVVIEWNSGPSDNTPQDATQQTQDSLSIPIPQMPPAI